MTRGVRISYYFRRPTEYCKRAVCETGLSHFLVWSESRSVELRTLMPNFAKSLLVDSSPPVETKRPASIAKLPKMPGITHRCHSDSGGVEELDEVMPRGLKILCWYSCCMVLPVMVDIAKPSNTKPLFAYPGVVHASKSGSWISALIRYGIVVHSPIR